MSDTEKNILIVSQDPEFAKNIRDVLPAGGDTRVSTEVSTFADMNGKGTQLAFQSDLVIFYADPDDAEEVSAIADLLKAREGHTAFMAFTNGEITIAKAQKLRDVGVDDVLPVSISQDELYQRPPDLTQGDSHERRDLIQWHQGKGGFDGSKDYAQRQVRRRASPGSGAVPGWESGATDVGDCPGSGWG